MNLKESLQKVFSKKPKVTEGFVYGKGWANLTSSERKKWVLKFKQLTGGDIPDKMKKAPYKKV